MKKTKKGANRGRHAASRKGTATIQSKRGGSHLERNDVRGEATARKDGKSGYTVGK